MGRPSLIKPVRVGSSRRGFFKNTGSAAAALLATPLLPLAGTADAAVAINANFQHGVASGDPLSDRVILWTRVTPTNGRNSQVVDYQVAKDIAFTQIVTSGRSKAILERDFTVKIDALGLSPNTTYYYRFSVDGVVSPMGRTKTLPVGGVVSNLRMAVVSCSNHAYGYFNAYRRIAERADLDMVVHLGDYIYEYGANQYGSVRTPEPANEIVTLADYRMRHAQYKRDPDSQAMHRQHPLVAIWDDHETANNSYVDGAENHQPSEGTWAARVGAALQAYYEWMPVRVVDPTKPRNNARSYAFGNLVDLIMLEERLGGRSAQLGTNIGNASGYFIQQGAYLDPARQLLGAEQETWLFNKLRSSSAKWKFLGQGVMFAQVKVQGAPNSAGGGVFFNSDAWDGYQPARDRVYDVLKGNSSLGQAPVNNVVILTGDIHSSWAADLSQDPNNANVATGGYDKVTGQGSRAVEFVGTSISSPGVDNPQAAAGTIASLAPANPHLKYINLDKRGYMLIDADANRCVCEWWHVDTVASISNVQTFATAFQVVDGANRLTPAAQTPNRANPAALAP